jgi:hypothetical protein
MKQTWINVADKLPTLGENVIVWVEPYNNWGQMLLFERVGSDGLLEWDDGECSWSFDSVTWWMPGPGAPTP